MAIAVVNIIGSVVKPDGGGSQGGTITITLGTTGHADDGVNEVVVSGSFDAIIDEDGSVDFNIIANSLITPSGSYSAKFKLNDGSEFTKTWTVAAAPSTQDIGDLS
jgi:hypothetical protein